MNSGLSNVSKDHMCLLLLLFPLPPSYHSLPHLADLVLCTCQLSGLCQLLFAYGALHGVDVLTLVLYNLVQVLQGGVLLLSACILLYVMYDV